MIKTNNALGKVAGWIPLFKIGDSPTAKELGIPVSLSTVRGFVTKKGAPAERVKELEAGMMKAMSHNYY